MFVEKINSMFSLFKDINILVLLKQFIIILWQFYTHIIRKKFISTEECKMDMWITNKDLLYTDNSTWYSVITYMGKDSKKE